MKYPISKITIGPRQREADQLGDIDVLADSMSRLGQFHSIGLRMDGTLVWGRRRLAAAQQLGWTEIEAIVRDDITPDSAYEMELEEDVRREGRTWQSEVISVAKLFRIKQRRARENGEPFGAREMARYTTFGPTMVKQYVFHLADALEANPRDEAIWACDGPTAALDLLRARQEREAYEEIQKRHAAATLALAEAGSKGLAPVPIALASGLPAPAPATGSLIAPNGKPAAATRLTIRERLLAYNQSFVHLGPPNTPLFYVNKDKREFLTGFWFVGGGNISDFYGSYQVEYLRRITSLFPDVVGKQEIVHLFSGSIPLDPGYTIVGLPDADHQPDVVCDAHNLSSGLGFQPFLIYADPPYSIEDSEHYANSMVDRARVLSECAVVLKPGGFVVWLDQALPVFSNSELQLVGAISYVRSTGNRFRVICIFQKPICQTTPSIPQETEFQ
ncbi:MAG: ParB N-terminal domain-containing protein [Patescibacteria group bacterium]|nr:ParB N-terminal domain-containing protein [Patescibacteria group bacterium]